MGRAVDRELEADPVVGGDRPVHTIHLRPTLFASESDVSMTLLAEKPAAIIRSRANILAKKARAGKLEDVIPTLWTYRDHLETAPLLKKIVRAVAEGALKDEHGEVLDGYARRTFVAAGAETASTPALVLERGSATQPVVHVRKDVSADETLCGLSLSADGNRFEIGAPRGSFQSPPLEGTRCNGCEQRAAGIPAAQEPSTFFVLRPEQREQLLQAAQTAVTRQIRSRRALPRDVELEKTALALPRDIRGAVWTEIRRQAADRLYELTPVLRFARWFAPFDISDKDDEWHRYDAIRTAIRKYYGTDLSALPMPSKQQIADSLGEFPRLPSGDDQAKLQPAFLAELIWQVWPDIIPEVSHSPLSRVSNLMRLHWQKKWPEVFEGIELTPRPQDLIG